MNELKQSLSPEEEAVRPAGAEAGVDEDAVLEELARELIELYRAGKIPADLDLQALCGDPEFVELTREFSLEAALRIYRAEHRLKDAESGAKRELEQQVRRRSGLPKSQRSNLSVNPSPDYRNMSSEEFRRLEQQYKRMAMAGKKVNL